MSGFFISSGSEQVAAHLREGVLQGRWSGALPGRQRLAAELGVSGKLVEAALALLEREGFLSSHGPRRRREIVIPEGVTMGRKLRVAILAYEPSDWNAPDTVELLYELGEMGNVAKIAPKTLIELDHSVDRVARLVSETPADAWVIFAGSQDVLEWFAKQQLPAFAYAGRANGVQIANIAPDREEAVRAAIRRLIEFGHRRIVLMVREERRKPEPGLTERLFLRELEAHGIPTGPYNLPDWEGTVEGYHRGLESLFQVTPPTALFISEASFAMATLQFCLARGLRIPEHLSLLCGDPDPAFAWCQPAISHIHWDHRPIVRRILRWVRNVSQGKTDLRKSWSTARLVDGETIGPVPKNVGEIFSLA